MFLRLATSLVVILASQSSLHASSQCNVSSNGFSVAKAVGNIKLAGPAIEQCQAATKALSHVPCKRAYRLLEEAAVHIGEVWNYAVDSGNNCWKCHPSTLMTQAAELAKFTKWYNSIVQSDGRYWQSSAYYNIEAIHTWSSAPMCSIRTDRPVPSPHNPPSNNPAIPEYFNASCTMKLISQNGTTWGQLSMKQHSCYAASRENSDGSADFLLYMNTGGYAPSSIPADFNYGWGNTCEQVLTQIQNRCRF